MRLIVDRNFVMLMEKSFIMERFKLNRRTINSELGETSLKADRTCKKYLRSVMLVWTG